MAGAIWLVSWDLKMRWSHFFPLYLDYNDKVSLFLYYFVLFKGCCRLFCQIPSTTNQFSLKCCYCSVTMIPKLVWIKSKKCRDREEMTQVTKTQLAVTSKVNVDIPTLRKAAPTQQILQTRINFFLKSLNQDEGGGRKQGGKKRGAQEIF